MYNEYEIPSLKELTIQYLAHSHPQSKYLYQLFFVWQVYVKEKSTSDIIDILQKNKGEKKEILDDFEIKFEKNEKIKSRFIDCVEFLPRQKLIGIEGGGGDEDKIDIYLNKVSEESFSLLRETNFLQLLIRATKENSEIEQTIRKFFSCLTSDLIENIFDEIKNHYIYKNLFFPAFIDVFRFFIANKNIGFYPVEIEVVQLIEPDLYKFTANVSEIKNYLINRFIQLREISQPSRGEGNNTTILEKLGPEALLRKEKIKLADYCIKVLSLNWECFVLSNINLQLENFIDVLNQFSYYFSALGRLICHNIPDEILSQFSQIDGVQHILTLMVNFDDFFIFKKINESINNNLILKIKILINAIKANSYLIKNELYKSVVQNLKDLSSSYYRENPQLIDAIKILTKVAFENGVTDLIDISMNIHGNIHGRNDPEDFIKNYLRINSFGLEKVVPSLERLIYLMPSRIIIKGSYFQKLIQEIIVISFFIADLKTLDKIYIFLGKDVDSNQQQLKFINLLELDNKVSLFNLQFMYNTFGINKRINCSFLITLNNWVRKTFSLENYEMLRKEIFNLLIDNRAIGNAILKGEQIDALTSYLNFITEKSGNKKILLNYLALDHFIVALDDLKFISAKFLWQQSNEATRSVLLEQLKQFIQFKREENLGRELGIHFHYSYYNIFLPKAEPFLMLVLETILGSENVSILRNKLLESPVINEIKNSVSKYHSCSYENLLSVRFLKQVISADSNKLIQSQNEENLVRNVKEYSKMGGAFI